MYIHPALASSSADDEAAGAYGWEYCVGITIIEKDGTLPGMFKELYRLFVFVGVSHTRTEQ
jgi:hypothetical protein